MKRICYVVMAAAAMAAMVSCGPGFTKSGLDPENFKAERQGKATALYTLTNSNGMEVCVTNFGARIVSVMVPDRNGEFKDVVLSCDKVSDFYPESSDNNFGAAIGRYGNRIGQGRFTLDEVEYQLPQNNYGHCLHGGPDGWHVRVFDVEEADSKHIKLSIVSPDGDAGFPGEVKAYITYTLTPNNKLQIDYEATTDAPTIINLTNHSYFNLSGDPLNNPVTEDMLYINAKGFTPVDSTFMTTGEILPVAGTPMDFTSFKTIGQDIEADYDQLHNALGYDHNWVLSNRGDINVKAAEVQDPGTGISMEVYTTEPGLQVYVGNFLDGSIAGKHGVAYPKRSAICLESQHYPDSPNKPEWPSVVLRPGETYRTTTIYAFSVK